MTILIGICSMGQRMVPTAPFALSSKSAFVSSQHRPSNAESITMANDLHQTTKEAAIKQNNREPQWQGGPPFKSHEFPPKKKKNSRSPLAASSSSLPPPQFLRSVVVWNEKNDYHGGLCWCNQGGVVVVFGRRFGERS